MRVVGLDSGPLGMVANPRARPWGLRCQQWARDLAAAGVRVIVPEIADYEVRRELIRRGATASLVRLDQIKVLLEYVPITTDIMLRAAELWAQARKTGRPTAGPDALDADCILAATALIAAGRGDVVTVATDNVAHLGQFIDARPWEQIPA
jgi:predicted nucleic acid-binding protein